MKILHIMTCPISENVEHDATEVMLHLHHAGVDQSVVIKHGSARYGELASAGLHLKHEVLEGPFCWRHKARVRRLIKIEKPDIIQCWTRSSTHLIPKVLPFYGPETVVWLGENADLSDYRRCQHFIGATQEVVRHLVENGVPQEEATFIPRYGDIQSMPALHRQDLETSRDDKVVLVLTRLQARKGVDVLLKAAEELPECVIWIAGTGPERAKLEAFASKLGISSRVRFLGDRTDRSALLHAADVCVLPSRQESFGGVMLEAWAAGVPFVACKSAGPIAHVHDKENGLLVEIDDASELAAAIRSTYTDQNLRRKLVANGFATYNSCYTRESITKQWGDFYKKISGCEMVS